MSESLVERARAFAIEVHDAIDHQRKYTGEPYWVHLEAVAALVEEISGTPAMVAAAWLHDAVEDTETTLADIERKFGPEVATLVEYMTDVSRPEDGNRDARKALDRAHLGSASPEAKTIKLADLIDNARSIVQYDKRFAEVYMREKELLLNVLREGNAELHRMATDIVDDYYRNERKAL